MLSGRLWGRWLAARPSVHALPLAAVGVALVAVHEALLSAAHAATIGESAYLHGLALAQCAMVVLTAAALAVVVPRAGRVVVAAAFAFVLLFYADALVSARADVHLTSLVAPLFDARLEANRRLLEATGVDGRALPVVLAALVALAASGAWVDATLERRGATLRASRVTVAGGWLLAVVAVVSLERGAARTVSASTWTRFARVVPLPLAALGAPTRSKTTLRAALRPLPDPPSVDAAIAALSFPTAPPPGDVFFFVVESLRADTIDAETAPAMSALRTRALPVDGAVAGGNVTHYAWFSLFTSQPALYWSEPPLATRGATPLRLARRRGWRLELLTASDPRYMGIDEVLFGPRDALIDALFDASGAPVSPAERDAEVLRELTTRAERPHPPTVFLVALDATHLPYTWSPSFRPPFAPFAPEGHYLQVQSTPAERDAVRRRYRDAVAYDDALLGAFVEGLRARGAYDDATFVVVGDHGEELGEHGALSHGSEPCAIQTHVPLVLAPSRGLRAGGDWSRRVPLASAIDVWPTLLDAAGVRGDLTALFAGHTLLDGSPRTAVTVQHRFGGPPNRFVLDDGLERAELELSDPEHPYAVQGVQLREWRDEDERPIVTDATPEAYAARLRARFGDALSRLFRP